MCPGHCLWVGLRILNFAFCYFCLYDLILQYCKSFILWLNACTRTADEHESSVGITTWFSVEIDSAWILPTRSCMILNGEYWAGKAIGLLSCFGGLQNFLHSVQNIIWICCRTLLDASFSTHRYGCCNCLSKSIALKKLVFDTSSQFLQTSLWGATYSEVQRNLPSYYYKLTWIIKALSQLHKFTLGLNSIVTRSAKAYWRQHHIFPIWSTFWDQDHVWQVAGGMKKTPPWEVKANSWISNVTWLLIDNWAIARRKGGCLPIWGRGAVDDKSTPHLIQTGKRRLQTSQATSTVIWNRGS